MLPESEPPHPLTLLPLVPERVWFLAVQEPGVRGGGGQRAGDGAGGEAAVLGEAGLWRFSLVTGRSGRGLAKRPS